MNIFCDLCNLLHHRKWLITLIDSYKNQSCLILTLTTNSRNTLTQLHVHVRLVPRKKHANVTKCIWVSNEWCCLYFCRLEKKNRLSIHHVLSLVLIFVVSSHYQQESIWDYLKHSSSSLNTCTCMYMAQEWGAALSS